MGDILYNCVFNGNFTMICCWIIEILLSLQCQITKEYEI